MSPDKMRVIVSVSFQAFTAMFRGLSAPGSISALSVTACTGRTVAREKVHSMLLPRFS
jgi:hypothetical protein